jgi:hypothetical protein
MPSDGMVKLTNEDLKWLIIRVGSGFFTVKKAAQVYGVMECRVQHVKGCSGKEAWIKKC